MRMVVQTEERAVAVAAEVTRQFSRHRERGLMVTIEPYYRPHTRSQTAKVHVMIAEMADALGYTRAELKEVLKQELWPMKEVRFRTGSVAVPKSTAELTREEASAVIERLIQVAAEMGVTLKDE